MSGSRKLRLRAAPRAPRRPAHTQHAEPVPLANRFQELLEQDVAAAPPPSQSRAVDHHGPTTTSMAQRLQDMLGESSPFGDSLVQSKRDVAAGLAARRGSEPLWNHEVEAVESDTSDHEEGTRGSAKGLVVPMGQRLDELLQEDRSRSRSRQEKPKQRQKGKRPLLEPKSVSNSDDIEACDNTGTPTYPDDVHVPTPTKPQTLPRIAEQFQEALMAAPSFDFAPLPSVQQFPRNQDYSTRLQRILQAEKLQHAEIAKGAPGGAPLDSIQVQIMKKSLEGRLVTCKCQVIQAPSKWTSYSPHVDQVQVIFNSKVAAELEIDVGRMVRIHPPWREVTLAGTTTRVILCTYFCEAVY